MRSFFVSLSSEFYKSRKTLAFWSAILLPLLICVLMSWGIISEAKELANNPAMLLWFRYISRIIVVMGAFLLPVLVIYNTYSITNMEYKGDTWKTLFSLPLPKLSIYASKYLYIVFLTFLTMALFCVFIIATGHGIQFIKPELRFGDYNPNQYIFKFFTKLFLSTIGIISLQFLMNLMWSDFLKPFGIGFLLMIMGLITSGVKWRYADFFPYAYPNLTAQSIMQSKGGIDKIAIFDQAIYNSLICGVAVFIIGYFMVARKTIK
ncbi:ABC transporter permease [Pedobacter sp. KR3-3]|uniref:ABC transporter permease n=1 Tax=Pedobacter albus TaxID=3113905 RepID=A0ABU7I9W0_9SPHI|nr:ABC transporter permease [Pedobacter sp. KR3-3]MEE1946147.1 ABC transporter permease [Pedobacter sp. KR3-3]